MNGVRLKASLKRSRTSRRFIPRLPDGPQGTMLESRSLTAPVFVLNLPNTGIGGDSHAWDVDDPESDNSDAAMAVSVSASWATEDWIGDGSGFTASLTTQANTQVKTVNNADGTQSISLSGSLQVNLETTNPFLTNADNLSASSRVGTDPGGYGIQAVSWTITDSTTGKPYTSPVTLSGNFNITYTPTAPVQGFSQAGFDFRSAATGVTAAADGNGNLVVTYPSGGT